MLTSDLEKADCVTKKPKSQRVKRKKKKKTTLKSEMEKKKDISIVGQTECLNVLGPESPEP